MTEISRYLNLSGKVISSQLCILYNKTILTKKGFRNNFPSYSDSGGKTVQNIFGSDILERSITKKAELFESCLFVNNGDRTFSMVKLPIEAQFSPVRGIVVEDFNSDGVNDIAVTGNNYSVRPSYGRYDPGIFVI